MSATSGVTAWLAVRFHKLWQNAAEVGGDAFPILDMAHASPYRSHREMSSLSHPTRPTIMSRTHNLSLGLSWCTPANIEEDDISLENPPQPDQAPKAPDRAFQNA